MARIITRAEWGAQHADGFGPAPTPAREVWLHHSAGTAPDLVPPWDDDYAAVRQIERTGQARFGGGMPYTFLVSPAGLIFEGLGIDRQGAHTAGRNDIARAICVLGNYDHVEVTDAQFESIVWLLRHGHAAKWWTPRTLTGGHRDVRATDCPGQHAYDAIPEINRRATAPDTTRPPEDGMAIIQLPRTPHPDNWQTPAATWPQNEEIINLGYVRGWHGRVIIRASFGHPGGHIVRAHVDYPGGDRAVVLDWVREPGVAADPAYRAARELAFEPTRQGPAALMFAYTAPGGVSLALEYER